MNSIFTKLHQPLFDSVIAFSDPTNFRGYEQ